MNASSDFTPVPTRASLLKQKHEHNEFQALVFEEPKSSPLPYRKKQISVEIEADAETNVRPFKQHTHKEEAEEFDIRRARNEVLKFAMNNQRLNKNKKKMEAFQLMRLGGKAPKKIYKNYKVLLDERKRLKQIREERRKLHQLGKNQTGAASVKCRSKTKIEKQKKKRAPVTAIDQHYGKVKPKLKK